jgi:hypothetical protein
MERERKSDSRMTQEQRVDALRFDFQERVGKHGAYLWTITEAEAKEMLAGNSVAVLLKAFTSAGRELKQLVFLTEEETLGLVQKKIIGQRAHQARETRYRKDQLTHRERHPASRVPIAQAMAAA